MNTWTIVFASIPMLAKFIRKWTHDHVIAITTVWWNQCKKIKSRFLRRRITVSSNS